MSDFKIESISIAGAPTIDFTFSGSLCAAECCGATLAAVLRDETCAADVVVTDATGQQLADITVRKLPAGENISVSLMNVGSALLWSHARWVAAQTSTSVAAEGG